MTESGSGSPKPASFRHGGNLRELAARAGLRPEEILDFSASINPLGPPEYLRSLISANLSGLLHYPDPDYAAFCREAANCCRVGDEQIITANGSTEIIYALPRALPVQRALVPAPSYIGYEEAMAAAGIPVHFLPLAAADDFEVDWQALGSAVRPGDLVFLGHPNNPTGRLLDPQQLAAAAKNHSEAFFVIDEAFIDFVQGRPSLVPLIGQGLTNIIVLCSLTKFYAVPGLRLGYGVAEPDTARAINRQLPPWRLNTLAAALGARVIGDHDYAEASRELVKEQRRYLCERLMALPNLRVFAGAANYLLLKVDGDHLNAVQIAERLLAWGIAVRVCDNFPGLDRRFLRIAVRQAPENDRLLAALEAILRPAQQKTGPSKTPALMFQGVCSDAGKSIMTASLGRILLQDGIQAAPFKSQNMSLNSFVTRAGAEMGRAQVVQAQACRLEPDARMNPILLKPSSQVGSQVIVNGRSVGNMTVDEYIAYKPQAFAVAKQAYDSLAAENEVMLLEGAGSPAEVNLKSHDIVNMQMALYAEAPVLIVGDIDRGGVFASFIGTLEVMAEWERQLVAGFLVNRFRGQESLLAPALSYTAAYTGRPVLGVVPYLADLGLPEEDSVSFKKGLFRQVRPPGDVVEICLVDLPHISNFTDFEPLLAEPDVYLKVVKKASELKSPDAVLLPGSKNVLHDLNYLQEEGLARRIIELADAGCEIVGICGGFQMLGRQIADPHHIEAGGSSPGLGLLPVITELAKDKTLQRQEFTHLKSGLPVTGYEIHHGRTETSAEPVLGRAAGPAVDTGAALNNIWGSYLHGLFDADAFRGWFIESLRRRRSLSEYKGTRPAYDLEPAFDRLAAMVRERIDMKKIYQLLGL